MIDNRIIIFKIANGYLNSAQALGIEVDLSNKKLYAYSLEEGEILQESRGVLIALNSDIADDLQNKLKIKLSEFGVEVINADPIEMPPWRV